MNKTESNKVKLAKGSVEVFDLGKVKLHACQTNDFLSDTVFLLEKNGKMLIIEQPCFFDNIKELTDYTSSLNVKVDGKILLYHMAGDSFLPEVPVFATKKANDYGHTGGGKGLITNFEKAFGAAFDSSISKVTNIINSSTVEIAEIKINVIETPEAFDIEIPEINTIYTHMIGSDTHSIVAGAGHAYAIIAYLKKFITKKYDFILSSHHMPESLNDVETKILYIEDVKKTATVAANAQEFKDVMKKKYPDYYGENYLDMTTSFFFPAK